LFQPLWHINLCFRPGLSSWALSGHRLGPWHLWCRLGSMTSWPAPWLATRDTSGRRKEEVEKKRRHGDIGAVEDP
jgi:hypothetical protein